MISNSMFRLMRYAVLFAVVLLVGTQFLSSATGLVALLQTGNILPLIPVVAIAAFFMLIARPTESKTPMHMLVNILAWSATGYLVVVAFVFFIPFGIIPAIASVVLTVTLFEQIRDPKDVQSIIDSFGKTIAPYSPTLVRKLSSRAISLDQFTNGVSVWTVPHDQSLKILHLTQTRPNLPISLTHYIDFDVLFVGERKDAPSARQVISLLKSSGISGLERATPFFTRFIVNLPVINDALGSHIQNYRIIHDDLTMESVLANWPIGATLVLDGEKRVVIARASDIVGFNSTPVPKGLEHWVLVKHDLSMIRLEEA